VYLIHHSCFLFVWVCNRLHSTPLCSAPCFGPRRCSTPADWQYLFTGGGTQGESRGGKPYRRQHERSFYPLSDHSHANEFI